MIEATALHKHYGDNVALNAVSFVLARGGMAFITGHSGAGKSTLLRLIAGLERPSSGMVSVDGRRPDRLGPTGLACLRRRMGVVLQDPLLIAERTVFENVALPLEVAGLGWRERTRRVRAALDKVALGRREGALPATLSAGEQQRVSIARAVVNKPELVLADEPTGNLDPALSQELLALFTQFHQVGVSVLIATHDLHLLQRAAIPILALREGRVVRNDLAV